MKKSLTLMVSLAAFSAMMTGHAHAGIKITTESLWYVLPSALVFLASMGITNSMKPAHLQFHEIRFGNSPAPVAFMRLVTLMLAIPFLGFLVWGIYGAYA